MTLAVAEMYVQGAGTRKVTAIGIRPDGKRSILGCSVQLSEAETHRRSCLQSLDDRGIRGVKLVVSDDHGGPKAVRQAVRAGVPWQLCEFHLIQNAMAHVPKIAMRAEAASQLAACLEENVPEALAVLRLPAAHRRRLRTTNGLERLDKEIKRRARVVTLFPNEASLLRLASAVPIEISDDWETERAYLNMEAR